MSNWEKRNSNGENILSSMLIMKTSFNDREYYKNATSRENIQRHKVPFQNKTHEVTNDESKKMKTYQIKRTNH